jgi:hypothetical protein
MARARHNDQSRGNTDLRSGLLVGKGCDIDSFDVHGENKNLQDYLNSQSRVNWLEKGGDEELKVEDDVDVPHYEEYLGAQTTSEVQGC